MRKLIRDAFVRRFFGGFALGLLAMSAWQGGIVSAHADANRDRNSFSQIETIPAR